MEEESLSNLKQTVVTSDNSNEYLSLKKAIPICNVHHYFFQWPIIYNLCGRHLVEVVAHLPLPVHPITEPPQDHPICTRYSPHHLFWLQPSRAWPQQLPLPTYSHCHPHPHLVLTQPGVNA